MIEHTAKLLARRVLIVDDELTQNIAMACSTSSV